ncbi:hypothetical protein LWI29_027786 [Acer saccharum]|uniref:Transcription repressor n=1 Tax=Acer saccharum TaxID=4024 RepID=A0AA39THG5_ACESA|nr:hypothetical protein LWI29_027786 [Acer saccharum]KAK1588436.1 hypothetical protein Q3G72_023223 [Acer saccharum]
MGKRFKVRISRIIPSSLQCCRSKDPKMLPLNPVPSFLRLTPVNPNPNPITLHFSPTTSSSKTKTDHHHLSLKRHVTSAIISFACGLRSRSSPRPQQYVFSVTDHTGSPPPTPGFHWEEDERFHVIAKVFEEETTTNTTATTPRQKIYNSSASGYTSPDDYEDDVVFPPLPPIVTERKKRRAAKKKTTPPPQQQQPKARVSTSSSVDTELFTSIKDEETETLVSSSRSFSTDSSSEFNPQLETIRETPFKRSKRCVSKNGKKTETTKNNNGGRRISLSSPETESSPARLSMFLQRLIPCTVDGKVRESFAVVKKSQDPYEDFRRSMMEMILEKQMFEEKELEQLLHCFLTLNSRQHHKVIVEAFSEIWEALFYRRFSSFRVSTSSK